MHSSRWLFAFASLSLSLAAALACFACGATADTSAPADAASSDADGGAGGLVIPPDATLTFKSKGGFAANGMATSICTLVDETYTFVVATGELTWKTCTIADGGSRNDYHNGNRVLTTADAAPLRASLAAVRIVPAISGACGADKPLETLEIVSPSALTPEVFYDTFDRCADASIVHVSGLDDVYNELIKLGH